MSGKMGRIGAQSKGTGKKGGRCWKMLGGRKDLKTGGNWGW